VLTADYESIAYDRLITITNYDYVNDNLYTAERRLFLNTIIENALVKIGLRTCCKFIISVLFSYNYG